MKTEKKRRTEDVATKMRRKPVTPKERTAYHEAGHAVVAYMLNWPLLRVTIESAIAGTDHLGGTFFSRIVLHGALVENMRYARFLLAGVAAERILLGRRFRVAHAMGSVDDWRRAESLIREFFTLQDVQVDETLVIQETEKHKKLAMDQLRLPQAWAAVEALAAELLKRGTLSGRAAEKIIHSRFRGD